MTGPPIKRPRTRALPFRAEVVRQLRRRRTLVSFGLLAALPPILVAAFALGDDPQPSLTGPRFVDLAQQGAANFTVFALFAVTGFMMIVIAALFTGDPVPSEASWSSLRYLLVAPVPRARLLTSKLVVGLCTLLVALIGFPAWCLLVGGLAYGWGPFTSPFGAELGWGQFLPRLLVIIALMFITLLQVGALAFLFGVLTDAALGAVGGAVLISVVSAILDGIDALGGLRDGLPLHFQFSWAQLLRPVIDWSEPVQGVFWSLSYATVFTVAAYLRFSRKDILS